jgi:hypothetical protein
VCGGNDRPSFFWFEIGDEAGSALLGRDRDDLGILFGARQIVSEQMLCKASDRSQAAVAGHRAVAPMRFDVAQEAKDSIGSDIVQTKTRDRSTYPFCQKNEEKAECVTVGTDGVSAGSADSLQVIVEVTLDKGQEGITFSSSHFVELLPFPLRKYRRRNRALAMPIKAGVAVRYTSVPKILSCPM